MFITLPFITADYLSVQLKIHLCWLEFCFLLFKTSSAVVKEEGKLHLIQWLFSQLRSWVWFLKIHFYACHHGALPFYGFDKRTDKLSVLNSSKISCIDCHCCYRQKIMRLKCFVMALTWRLTVSINHIFSSFFPLKEMLTSMPIQFTF